MKNVIIIGPPASGKLTVAKRLAEDRGYFLFDNHRSIDAAEVLTKDQSVSPKGLVGLIRKTVFQEMKRSGTPLIFTMVYAYPVDDPYMEEYIELLTGQEKPLVVQFYCSREDSKERCQEKSREGTSKIIKPDEIDDLHAQYDLDSKYRSDLIEVLYLNTSELGENEIFEAINQKI